MNWIVMAKVLVAFAITLHTSAVIFALIGNFIVKRRIRQYRSEHGYKPCDYKVPYRVVDCIYDALWIGVVALGIWFVIS